LRIAELPVGPGMIGLTFAPGKHQDSVISGRHRRDLGMDLDVVAEWRAQAVLRVHPKSYRFLTKLSHHQPD
jgi:hypothetical protein